MPQLLRIGPYIIYFWSNESEPLEPVHVHISEGIARKDATKVWITSTGKTLLCNNNSKIPERILNKLLRVVEANSAEFMGCLAESFRRNQLLLLKTLPFHGTVQRFVCLTGMQG